MDQAVEVATAAGKIGLRVDAKIRLADCIVGVELHSQLAEAGGVRGDPVFATGCNGARTKIGIVGEALVVRTIDVECEIRIRRVAENPARHSVATTADIGQSPIMVDPPRIANRVGVPCGKIWRRPGRAGADNALIWVCIEDV